MAVGFGRGTSDGQSQDFVPSTSEGQLHLLSHRPGELVVEFLVAQRFDLETVDEQELVTRSNARFERGQMLWRIPNESPPRLLTGKDSTDCSMRSRRALNEQNHAEQTPAGLALQATTGSRH